MKNAELIALMIANTNKTKNLRTYGKKWFSGARRICDRIATKIGKMIALIQDNIDRGKIINGKTQSLLVYNFQPLFANTSVALVTFDMVVKPIEEINNTHDMSGMPLQLVVDIVSGDVMNNARAMSKMNLSGPDFHDDIQNPVLYGNFREYQAVASFIALRHHNNVDADDIFSGKLDNTPFIQSTIAFDSLIEARTYLDNNWANYCMIAEMNYPKEHHSHVLASGLVGAHIIKLVHPHKPQIEVSHMLATFPKEHCVEDEVHHLLAAAKEHEAVADFGIASS